MNIWYSARNIFNSVDDGWKDYIDFSGLTQTEELISLDSTLSNAVFRFNVHNSEDWRFGVYTESEYYVDCYRSIEYVVDRAKYEKIYNLLALCFEPAHSCNDFQIENFTFIGYDLLDQNHERSALINYDHSFHISIKGELNKFGVINHFQNAKDIHAELLGTSFDNGLWDTNIWAIWRHNIIGQK